MIYAVTGHRQLGGYSPQNQNKLDTFALRVISRMAREESPGFSIITGMALGWDQAIALACSVYRIPYTAAIPFKGQEDIWPQDAKDVYHALLQSAAKIVTVSEGGFQPWKMQARNEWMVDHADKVVALWDERSTGGTWNCVKYAQKKGKEVINVWKEWEGFHG